MSADSSSEVRELHSDPIRGSGTHGESACAAMLRTPQAREGRHEVENGGGVRKRVRVRVQVSGTFVFGTTARQHTRAHASGEERGLVLPTRPAAVAEDETAAPGQQIRRCLGSLRVTSAWPPYDLDGTSTPARACVEARHAVVAREQRAVGRRPAARRQGCRTSQMEDERTAARAFAASERGVLTRASSLSYSLASNETSAETRRRERTRSRCDPPSRAATGLGRARGAVVRVGVGSRPAGQASGERTIKVEQSQHVEAVDASEPFWK